MEATSKEFTRTILALFDSKRKLYESFTGHLQSLLCELLVDAGLEFLTVEARVKERASIQLKIEEKRYDNPLAQLTDFSGLRIIAYDTGTVDAICALINEEFDVDPDNSGDTCERLTPSEFGYQSVHLVAELSAKRLQLREYQRYNGLKAEIQVRTVVQHAWATTYHKLSYKRRQGLPEALVRDLYRCAAVLETVDRDFRKVLQEVERSRTMIAQSLSRGELDLDISFDSLEAYVQSSVVLQKLAATACSVGYCPDEQISAEHYERRLAGAIEMCGYLGITTLRELDDYLQSTVSWCHNWLRDLRRIGGRRQVRERIPPSATPLSVLRHMLIGHIEPSLTLAQLNGCACGGAVTEHLIEARTKSSAGRERR